MYIFEQFFRYLLIEGCCLFYIIYIFDIFSLTMSKKHQDKTGTGNSRGCRKTWVDNDMVSAMDAVKSGHFTITAAATQFSVPRKTLDDRIKGRVTHGSKPGVSTALTSIEEESLVSYLIYMANRGFPLTRTMVKAFAWSIAKRCGTCDRFNTEYGPGEKWWTLFKQQHPQLALLHFRSDSDSDNVMVQSAQYVDVTNLKDLEMRLSSG